MADITYRGITTKRLYVFDSGSLPASVTDGTGAPLATTTISGETAILTNRDGSPARGTAGPPGSDPYGPGIIPSPWETQ